MLQLRHGEPFAGIGSGGVELKHMILVVEVVDDAEHGRFFFFLFQFLLQEVNFILFSLEELFSLIDGLVEESEQLPVIGMGKHRPAKEE